ncbi:hypothetical protein AX16_001830 [Volvariella volvacea WC 439]|nr:hypothetical protein AX16_001830 [Volvariella volvacea WC 439]
MITPHKSTHTPNFVVSRVDHPPRTWYGVDFHQDELPYSSTTTYATPVDLTLEHNFWKKHIKNYSPSSPTTPNNSELSTHATHINNFPTELLCKILGFASQAPSPCVDPQDSINTLLDDEDRHKIDLNPLLLGQVCVLWRNIVRSMPQLWSTIRLFNPNPSQAHLAELYLMRSGTTTPLTLSLQQGESLIDDEFPPLVACNSATKAVLSLFVKQIHRWRGIDFRLLSETAQFFSLENGITPGATGILEVAHVKLVDWEDEHDNGWEECMWECVRSSPVLKDLCWDARRHNIPAPPMLWNQITHLELICGHLEQLFGILPHLRDIEALRFYCSSDGFYTPPPGPSPIVLARLHTLDLEVDNLPDVLQRIVVPSLKRVHIRSEEMASLNAVHFHEFLARSQCRIEDFTLSAHWFRQTALSDDIIVKFLDMKETDALKDVRVMRIIACVGDATVSLLRAGRFPSLQTLSLPFCRTSDGAVAGMLYRCFLVGMEEGKGAIPIERAKVGFVGCGHGEDKYVIRELVEGGCEIDLVSGPCSIEI